MRTLKQGWQKIHKICGGHVYYQENLSKSSYIEFFLVCNLCDEPVQEEEIEYLKL